MQLIWAFKQNVVKWKLTVADTKARFDPIHEMMKPYDIELNNDPMQLIATIQDISSPDNGPPANGVFGDSNLGSACVGLNEEMNEFKMMFWNFKF